MKKRVLTKIGIIAAVVLIAVGVPLAMGYSKVTGLELVVQYPNESAEDIIINKQNITYTLAKQYGDFTKYQRRQIPEDDIKTFLEKMDFIDHAVVSVSLSGVLRVTVMQKMIIVNVYTSKGEHFYIDNKRNIIYPKTDTITAQCLIANGDFVNTKKSVIDSTKDKDLEGVYYLANIISQDDVLKQSISAIFKNKDNYILVLYNEDCSVIFGKKEQWNENLNKLHHLISSPNADLSLYTSINLTYHNQAVCTKPIKEQ